MFAFDFIEEMNKMNVTIDVFMADAYTLCLKGELTETQVEGIFDFILDLNYENISADIYFTVLKFVRLIFQNHFSLVKSKIESFKNKVNNFGELIMLVEYAIYTSNKEHIKTVESIFDSIQAPIKSISLFGIEMNEFQQFILFSRCLTIVDKQKDIKLSDIKKFIEIDPSKKFIFYCIFPYAIRFNLNELISDEIVCNMLRDNTVDQILVEQVMNIMPHAFFKNNSEFISSVSKVNRRILHPMSNNADCFVRFPDTLKSMIISTDCDLKESSWEFISKCKSKFLTPVLRGRKCPQKYALIISQTPQDFMTANEAKVFLDTESEDYILDFFENLNITTENSDFFNDEALLETMETKYDSKRMKHFKKKLSCGHKTTEINLDKLSKIIIEKNIRNVDLFSDYLPIKECAIDTYTNMIKYFSDNRIDIKTDITNLALSLDTDLLFLLVNNNPNWEDYYHTLLEIVVIRKCADPPISDKYVRVKIPDISNTQNNLLSNLTLFLNESDGFIPKDLYSQSKVVQQFFFAGQLVNIPFESQIEWKYTNLEAVNFFPLIACSCLYYKPTEKFKKDPLSFVSSNPLEYAVFVPLPLFIMSTKIVLYYFCQRCTRFLDKQLTIYMILTLTINLILSKTEIRGIIINDVIKFIVKESEVFSFENTSAELKNIIKEKINDYGGVILKKIAKHAQELETFGVMEALDLNIFPVEHVINLALKMKEDKKLYPVFRSRVLNGFFKYTDTDLMQLFVEDKNKNWRGVYNITQHIGNNNGKRVFPLILSYKDFNPLSKLIIMSTKPAPLGDYLLNLVEPDELVKTITSVMTPKNENDKNIASLIQNVITRATSGDKNTNYMFAKHFMELSFLSCPHNIVKSLISSCACQEIYSKSWEKSFVRVTEDVMMKTDWRNFKKFSELNVRFMESLFLNMIGIPGQLSMGGLLILVGQHSWSIPDFKSSPRSIIELILQRGINLERAESSKKLGYDAFQTVALLVLTLYTAEMRNSFFTEIVPNFSKYQDSQKILILLILIHHLIDCRTQIFTYTSLIDKLSLIAEESIKIKYTMTSTEFKLLLAGTIFFATFAQVDNNLSPEAKSLSAAMFKEKDFILKYCVTDGTSTMITDVINEEVIKFIFNLDKLPNSSQYTVVPRSVSFTTVAFRDPLSEIAKPNKDFPGVSKHLPFEVQIRLANKYLPERPAKINTAMYLELFKYGDFAVRYFCSERTHLMLPNYVPIIIKATEAINKLIDVPDPSPIPCDYNVLLKKISELLEVRKANKLMKRYIDTVVASLIPNYGPKIMENITSSKNSAFTNFCSIIKRVKDVSRENIEAFMKYLYPEAIKRCAFKGDAKIGYSVISTVLMFNIKPNNEMLSITKSFLSSKDRHIWFRGVKMIPLYHEEFQKELITEAFRKVCDIQSISLFLSVCPKEGPNHPEKFLHILKKVIETNKVEDMESCNIIFNSLVSPYTGKEKRKELFKRDPMLWNLVTEHIEWIWKMFKEKGMFSEITKFFKLLPFHIRASEARRVIESLVSQESMALFVVQNEINFEKSMGVILNNLKTQEAIHSKIYIKFPDMKDPEAGGVLRGWLTTISEEIVDPKHEYFIPSYNNTCFTLNPKCIDFSMIEAIGRFIGIVVLHGEVLGYQISKHIIKHLINRSVNIENLAEIEPIVYNTLKWLEEPENDPEELFLDFTVNDESGNTIELVEGGKDIDVTRENSKEYIDAMSNFYLCKQCEKQILALKKGFQFVLNPDIFSNLKTKEVCDFICGRQIIDVEELIKNFEVLPPLTKDHQITKMFFNVIRRWDQDKLSKLFVFMTSAHIVPVGGYEFMKSKGRQPKLKLSVVDGDKLPLPSALTCFSHLSIPPYKTEEEMENGLIIAITESEGYK